MIPRSKKTMGWAMLVGGIVILFVMLFYAFNSPLDWKSRKLAMYLFIAFFSSFIPILSAGNIPFSDRMGERLPKQAKWRQVLTKTGYIAGYCCFALWFVLDIVAWISCQFVEPKIMQAEIMVVHTSYSRGCTEWTLKLADQTEVRVCKTGPWLEWQSGQIIEVSVRESALAYEVSYYRH